jgi:undecaprenyl-diphosphatase
MSPISLLSLSLFSLSPIEVIILGIIQGLTEFAPVSSSAHLVIVPWLFGWEAPSIAFDTMLHLGTLAAVLLVFANDLWRLALAWFRSLIPPFRVDSEARTAWLLVLATIPGAVAGYVLKSTFEKMFESPVAVGFFLLGTAAILIVADTLGQRKYDNMPQGIWQALLIGIAQAGAIAPGISRSGATISTAMLLGHTRTAAARFSFLLSVPIILGAGASQAKDFTQTSLGGDVGLLVLGFFAAAISGYLCIRFLLAYLASHSLRIFAAYCFVLGIGVITAGLMHLR